MNNILVINNKLPIIDNENIKCFDNKIIVKNNSLINIEYINCDNINIIFEINNYVIAKIFEFSIDNDINIKNEYITKKNATLNISSFFNNKKCNNEIIINLNGENSIINYNFACISYNSENYIITIKHNRKNTISNINNSAIVLNNSCLEFDVNSYLPKNNKNCILNQESRIIVMDKNNSIIKPNMYIEEADVVAKHSSTIGSFNQNDIFYLMTKGISYNDSIKLLIKGFLFKNLDCPIEIREKILNIFNKYWR